MKKPSKAITRRSKHILTLFCLSLGVILLRVWFLSVLQYDLHYEASQKPQRRLWINRVERATIRDRFNLPLAINQIEYNAAISYAAIRQIPHVTWIKENGKRKRIRARKDYVQKLSAFLGEKLDLLPADIADLILGKACLFPHTPFVIKEGISEELFYQLKMEERNWLGLHMQERPKRVYPYGKVAGDIIGYTGAISENEYLAIAREISLLREYFSEKDQGKPIFLPKGYASPEEAEKRLKLLEEKGYTINDFVGKAGIEKSCDQILRGKCGTRQIEVDTQGNFLRELSGGRPAISGQRVILSLSIEMQQHAEKLLAAYEATQDAKDARRKRERRHPWIRGGSIVALDPKTAEVIAMASTPRFDPNDFIEKEAALINQALENMAHIGAIWEGRQPLEREIFDPQRGKYVIEQKWLGWEEFLTTILPQSGRVYQTLASIKTLEEAERPPLDSIPLPEDQLLVQDILRLIVPDPLPDALKTLSLPEAFALMQESAEKQKRDFLAAKKAFHEGPFQEWKEKEFPLFLREKRKEEKRQRRYARPYIEYLQAQEKALFADYWENIREKDLPFRSFTELNRPLLGRYPFLRSENGVQLEKHLAAAFYPFGGFGTGRSWGYRQATPMGSVFKLVPAFAALKQHQKTRKPLLVLNEEGRGKILGHYQSGEPIKRFHKGGTLPRATHPMGTIDLGSALEQSANLYFSLLTAEYLENPLSIKEVASEFGFGTKSGIDLPWEYAGILPEDLMHNKTGLYSFAIGQHSLVVTPLQTALFLSAIANGGELLKPQIIKWKAGSHGDIEKISKQVRTHLSIDPEVRKTLLGAMTRVTAGEKGTARAAAMRPAFQLPEAMQSYKKFHTHLYSKTGTAEILYKQTIDRESSPSLDNHVSFATYSEEANLVVVVYLRFGDAGNQGAPLAASMIDKWQEICSR